MAPPPPAPLSPIKGWQRVEAALAGRLADRPPISIWKHYPTRDTTAEGLVEAMVEHQRKFNWDFIKVMPHGLYCVEDWGCRIRFPSSPKEVGRVERSPIEKAQDWRRLRPLSPEEGALAREVEVIRRLVQQMGEEVPVLPTVFSPSTVASKLAGELFFEHLRGDPEALRDGLAVITETTRRLTRAFLDAGAQGIFFATQMAGHPRFPGEHYSTLCRPDDLAVLEELKGRSRFSILHLHGEAIDFKAFLDYPVEALNWHDQHTWPSLGEARRLTAKTLVGGIVERSGLAEMEEASVEAMLRRAYEEAGPGGFIFGPGCVVHHWEVSDERLHFIRRWVEEGCGRN